MSQSSHPNKMLGLCISANHVSFVLFVCITLTFLRVAAMAAKQVWENFNPSAIRVILGTIWTFSSHLCDTKTDILNDISGELPAVFIATKEEIWDEMSEEFFCDDKTKHFEAKHIFSQPQPSVPLPQSNQTLSLSIHNRKLKHKNKFQHVKREVCRNVQSQRFLSFE